MVCHDLSRILLSNRSSRSVVLKNCRHRRDVWIWSLFIASYAQHGANNVGKETINIRVRVWTDRFGSRGHSDMLGRWRFPNMGLPKNRPFRYDVLFKTTQDCSALQRPPRAVWDSETVPGCFQMPRSMKCCFQMPGWKWCPQAMEHWDYSRHSPAIPRLMKGAPPLLYPQRAAIFFWIFFLFFFWIFFLFFCGDWLNLLFATF